MNQDLQDASKSMGIDMVDSGFCHYIWKACDGIVFEHIRSSDFIAFINLHKGASIPIIRNRQVGKMCYILYEFSQHHSNKGLVKQWLVEMLAQLEIDCKTYKHHHLINTNLLGTSKSNRLFAERIQKAIKWVDTINL